MSPLTYKHLAQISLKDPLQRKTGLLESYRLTNLMLSLHGNVAATVLSNIVREKRPVGIYASPREMIQIVYR